jgi:hypothetical protein
VTLLKYFSHPSFRYLPPSNPIHTTKAGTANRLEATTVVATHLDKSNYLVNQKQGAVNKYDLIVFIRLFQGSSRALEAVDFSRITAECQWIHWI